METARSPFRTLFTVFGVPVTANAVSWQFIPPKIVIGIVVALIAKTNSPMLDRVGWGIVYGLLLISLLCLHIVGHIISSKRVSPPMSEARIAPTLIQTLYPTEPHTPPRVHVIRSLGGPIMTLSLALISLLLWQMFHNHLLLFFALANAAIAFIVLLPLPTVDGEVLWREAIAKFRK